MPQPKSQDQLSQSAIDWQSFYTSGNIPIIGYDPINDQIVIKRGANNSAGTTMHEAYIYDMRTGAWTKTMNGLSANVDVSNFVVNGDNELVFKVCEGASSSGVYAWRPGPVASSAFKWTSKAFDFNYPALKKKLYKVIVHAKKGENTVIKAGYDNAAPTNLFTSNTFNTSADLKKNEFTITTPTAFSYITIQVESDGTTHQDFEINDIALVYRVLRPH